jgi:hypothetical protein
VAFEQDPCRVYAASGELLAEGFVREHHDSTILVEAENFSGIWLEVGDAAVVEVMSAHKGACTYDARVSFSAAHRIALDDLRLREVVQQRSAVRVPTSIPLRVTHRVVGTEREPLDEPLKIVVIDVSAHGLRFRCAEELPVGTRLALTLETTRQPLALVAEVLRTVPIGAEHAHGCVLVGLGERQMDELFHFVLDEQRHQLADRRERG